MQLISQSDVILLLSWWRLSKLDPHISVGNQLSRHVIGSAQLVFASVEINLPSLLSFLTFDCHCHSASHIGIFKLARNERKCVFDGRGEHETEGGSKRHGVRKRA